MPSLIISRFLAVCIALLITGMAFADPLATQAQVPHMGSWKMILLDHLLELVGAVVLSTLIPAIPKFFELFAARMGISISTENQHKAQSIAQNAVRYAEEWARSKVRSHGAVVKGEEKYAEAASFAVEQMEKFGLDEKMKDVVTKLILSSLNEQRPLPPNPATLPSSAEPLRTSSPPTTEEKQS